MRPLCSTPSSSLADDENNQGRNEGTNNRVILPKSGKIFSKLMKLMEINFIPDHSV